MAVGGLDRQDMMAGLAQADLGELRRCCAVLSDPAQAGVLADKVPALIAGLNREMLGYTAQIIQEREMGQVLAAFPRDWLAEIGDMRSLVSTPCCIQTALVTAVCARTILAQDVGDQAVLAEIPPSIQHSVQDRAFLQNMMLRYVEDTIINQSENEIFDAILFGYPRAHYYPWIAEDPARRHLVAERVLAEVRGNPIQEIDADHADSYVNALACLMRECYAASTPEEQERVDAFHVDLSHRAALEVERQNAELVNGVNRMGLE